jgi:threonine/homoserine/homoserine lactone efflux protein
MTESLLPFIIATLALNLTPGPDMLYVSTRSVMQGRRAGIVSALGIAAGALVHTALIASGLATLLKAVPLAYDIVRYAGAAYLIWLGIQTWRSRGGLSTPTLERASDRALFRQGMITNLLNPKVALFFLAFLPQFANPEAGSIAVQIILLGCLFNASGTLVNVAVACLASSTRRWIGSPRIERALQWGSGSVFIALGLRLALADRR